MIQFLVQHVESLEVITAILTKANKLNKLKTSNSSFILQRIEVTEETTGPKTGERDRYQESRLTRRSSSEAEVSHWSQYRREN